jgi:copper chaperone
MTIAATNLPLAAVPHTATYTVDKMSCGHCVAAVTEELTKVDGVRGVQIDLPTKAVTVTSEAPLDVAVVKAAVEEAGYVFAH